MPLQDTHPTPAFGGFGLRSADNKASDEEIRQAALQFVRKISGYRNPSRVNTPAFDGAVDEITAVSRTLLDSLQVRAAASR